MFSGTLWTDMRKGMKRNTSQRIRWVGSMGLVWWSVALLLDIQGVGAGVASDADILNLLEVKRSILDTCAAENLNILPDWNEADSNPCHWSGVGCDPLSLRVVSLEIHRTNGHGDKNWPKSPACEHPFRHHHDGFRDCKNYEKPFRSCGTLSPAVWKLSELRHLTIACFGLSGRLSKQVGGLQSLVSLDLHSNLLTGNLPTELGLLPNLTKLHLQDNAFDGRILAELSLSRELAHVDLSQNMFSGRISTNLGTLQNLKSLRLSGNRLTGPIPASLVAGKRNLKTLDLSENFLNGGIPQEIGSCQKLEKLHLSFNSLSGTLPSDLSRLVNLRSLQLAGNSFQGALPDQLVQCRKVRLLILTSDSAWSSCLQRSSEGNKFSGPLPPGLSVLPRLRVLWAPGAGLGGYLPEDWNAELSVLNLADNFFFGDPPLGLCQSKKISFLNLSSNQLVYKDFPNWVQSEPWGNRLKSRSGSRSTAHLGNRPNLLSSWCNDNFQSRTGTLLSSSRGDRNRKHQTLLNGGTSSLDEVTDGRRRRLLRPILRSRILASNSSDDGDNQAPAGSQNQSQQKKLNSVLVAAITSGCAIAIVLIIIGLMFQCSKYRSPPSPRQPHRPAMRWLGGGTDAGMVRVRNGAGAGAGAGTGAGPGYGNRKVVTFTNIPNLTYENVVKATGNFSIDKLIGSGGFGTTYKAELKQGLVVAVKRLNVGKFQGVQQFETEIRTLGSIRHPNLVTLLGYHARQEEMFLIYNYFSRGNLETLIHDSKRELPWKTVHGIALRIAEALRYLHDECKPRVLHRDIKPSNILLDEELNAHVADFGLARLLGTSETHATTDVAGTFGYVAPEYAMTCRVTEKADVYSFGVVLLELLSGKRALDPTFSEYGNGFNIVTWACLLIRQERPQDVFTRRLREEGPEKSHLETLRLAVVCTAEPLSLRPPMRHVVDTLRQTQPLGFTM